RPCNPLTGAEARARSHRLRASHDAVLVGIGTVLADDPLLTARTVPLPEHQPLRIVIDSHGRTPLDGRLVKSVGLSPVIVAVAGGAHPDLESVGASVWTCGDAAGRVSPAEVLRRAEVEGVTSLMVEGGGQVAASFLKADLVHEIAWFRAPILIGGDGLPGIGALSLQDLPNAVRWRATATERIGDDVLETYVRASD
ncbi:MAG: RibD family protein, partial [Pseudomonadota bacterium]